MCRSIVITISAPATSRSCATWAGVAEAGSKASAGMIQMATVATANTSTAFVVARSGARAEDGAAEFDHIGDERSDGHQLEGGKPARRVQQLLGREIKEHAQPYRRPGVDRIGKPAIGRRQRPDRLPAPDWCEIACCERQIVGSQIGCKIGFRAQDGPPWLPPEQAGRWMPSARVLGLRPRARR